MYMRANHLFMKPTSIHCLTPHSLIAILQRSRLFSYCGFFNIQYVLKFAVCQVFKNDFKMIESIKYKP